MPSTRGDVTIVVGSEVAAAAQKWDQLRRQGPEAFEKALRDLATQGGRSGRKVEQQFQQSVATAGRAALAFAGLAGTFQTLSTLISVIREEINQIERIRAQRAEQQLDFARELETFAVAAGPGERITPDEMARIALRVSRETGVAPTEVVRAGTAAISARGEIEFNDAIRALQETARLIPLANEETRAAVAAGAARASAFAESPEAAVASLLKAFRALPATDPRVIGERAVPTILGIRQLAPGTTPEAAFALMAAISQTALDPRLDLSSTAAINLTKQLQEALLKEGAIDRPVSLQQSLALLKSGRGPAERARQRLVGFFDRETGGRTVDDPELTNRAKTFAATIGFIQTLDDSTQVMKEFNAVLKQGVTFQADALTEQREARRERQASQIFAVAEADIAGKATTGVLNILDQEAQVKRARETTLELLRGTGASRLTTALGDFTLQLARDSPQERLQALQETLLRRQARIAGTDVPNLEQRAFFRGQIEERREELPLREQQSIDALQAMVERLDILIAGFQGREALTLEGPDGERVPARSGAQQVVNP